MEQRSQANTVGLDHTHKVQCIMQRTFRTIMFRRGSLAKGSDGHRHHPSTRAEERCEANYFQQTTAMLKCKFDKFRAPHTLHKWTDCAHEVCICQKGKEEGFKDSYLHAASAASCPFASWERHHHADTTRTQQLPVILPRGQAVCPVTLDLPVEPPCLPGISTSRQSPDHDDALLSLTIRLSSDARACLALIWTSAWINTHLQHPLTTTLR
ncbi:uncharacterized protein LOC133658589 isoform X2 [Entelurus aequoreus]|uniref:uncharacterized protein LOC133658589 isoform X2 n=1 Tax=Entelurus aequoreus TaxID=161455 RepID=UPI002B1D8912|nr:uncharacterized protein LOC133658589 isoform X2 [Entelurus aequoreus]